MRAAVRTRYGPPEVVHLAEVPKPSPEHDQLLVRVHATTVNRTDCAYRAARPFFMRLFTGLVRPRVSVLGTEYAGVVEVVGADVTAFAPGDHVFGYVEGSFGAHAEWLAAPATGLVATIPDGLGFEQAAAGTEGAHYAWAFLETARAHEGQRVLVIGATGGIGSAAVQLLKQRGAHVTAVCSGEHAGLVRELGADRVVDRDSEDFTRLDETFDIVVDAVGKSTFGRCRRLLEPRGVYLSSELGPKAQNPILALVTPLLGRRRVKFPVPRNDPRLAGHLRELLATGAFRPLVDRVYPWEEIVEAYRYVESGQKIGNVVLRVVADGAVDVS